MPRKAVAARLDPDVRRELQALMKHYDLDQSEVVRRALARGLRELRLQLGIDEFRDGRASLARGAELAGVSVFEFMDELVKHRVAVAEMTHEDILEDVAAVKAWKS